MTTLTPALLPAAEATKVGSPAINISIFAVFVLVTLTIVIKVASGKKTASQMYTAGGAFSGRQNGIAIAGDYLSAASFLGIAGAIALQGYDGFLYSIGFLVAWLVALLLVAELMRNTGRLTMADVLSYRLRQRPVRLAAASSALAVSFFYLLAQMAGAGALVLCAGGMGLRMARRGIPTGWDLAVQMSSLLPWAVWTAVGADQGVHLGLTLGWIPVICWLLARIVKQLRAIPAAQPAA